ncbi:MAG: hypothetical protein JW838_00175 [Spirochaetes bacterium]|nr:hypothetical protein [Spirochaetota bacterium]
MKKAIIILFAACLPLIFSPPAAADVLLLYQGSVLTGKIISDDGTRLVLKNYYGTYRIKRSRIDDILPTNSSNEDMAILRKRNLPFERREVILNYRAGTGEIAQYSKDTAADTAEDAEPPETVDIKRIDEKRETGEKGPWTSGRISFSGTFFNRIGGGNSVLHDGYTFHVALDQGLDFRPGGRHPFIPGLRFEGSYLYFRKASRSLSGAMAAAGLIWALPSMKNRRGCFIIALMPGVSILKAGSHGAFAGGYVRSGGTRFVGQAIAGYQKSFGPISFFILGRYLYIPGNKKGLMAAGAEAGIGFNVW